MWNPNNYPTRNVGILFPFWLGMKTNIFTISFLGHFDKVWFWKSFVHFRMLFVHFKLCLIFLILTFNFYIILYNIKYKYILYYIMTVRHSTPCTQNITYHNWISQLLCYDYFIFKTIMDRCSFQLSYIKGAPCSCVN